jgi:hypothetical protein
MTMRLAAFWFLVFTGTAGTQEPRRTIEIPLAISKAKATELIQAAAVKEGWMVASSEGGVITLAPFETRKNKAVSVTVRANVLGSDSSSSVVIGGSWSNAIIASARQRNPMAAGYPAEGTIESGGRGFMKDAWEELERVAEAIRKANR